MIPVSSIGVGSSEITATWLLAFPAGLEPGRTWKSTLVGHDIFHRQ